MMNRILGIALMAAGLCGAAYAVYLLTSREWALLFGGFCVYVCGYNLYNREKPSPEQRVAEYMQERGKTHLRNLN